MKSGHRYDIVRKETEGRRLWLEAAEDLGSAAARIRELTSFWPGEFEVMDQDNHQLVATIEVRAHSVENTAERDFARH